MEREVEAMAEGDVSSDATKHCNLNTPQKVVDRIPNKTHTLFIQLLKQNRKAELLGIARLCMCVTREGRSFRINTFD